jgi:hypothetical protein
MSARTSVRTSIWREMHEAGLSHPARSLFLFLTTDPTTNEAGVTTLAPARWAALLALDVDQVETGLVELEHTGFVVADRTTGEIVTPVFFAWNFGGMQGYRRIDYLGGVVSEIIRDAALGR